VDATSAKIKSLQTDMLREISGMLKVAACMDDDNTARINDIVFRLDHLVDALEQNMCEDVEADKVPQNIYRTPPALKIVP